MSPRGDAVAVVEAEAVMDGSSAAESRPGTCNVLFLRVLFQSGVVGYAEDKPRFKIDRRIHSRTLDMSHDLVAQPLHQHCIATDDC